MPSDDDRLFRRKRRDGSLHPVWIGWFFDPELGKHVYRSTRVTSRRAAARIRKQWEDEAAEPDHAAARGKVLLDAVELLLEKRQEEAKAGRKADATLDFYTEKTGHWLRILGEQFPLAQLRSADVDRYITQRRGEWSVPPRAEVHDAEGKVVQAAHAGRAIGEHTISKELVALRAALKLARRAGMWKGDPAQVLPVGFAPDYEPREHFLTSGQLEVLVAQLLPDAAARVAYTVATSAEDSVAEGALRTDVDESKKFVHLRGTKTKTRDRVVPIVTQWQRDLLDFALENAGGKDGKLFCSRTKFQQTLGRACQRAGVPHTTPNDMRRTYSTWLRACGVPNELIAPTMGHKDTRMLDRVYARLPPAMLRARLLQALGIQDAKAPPAPCSAGAVDASSQAGRIGQDGREGEAVTLGNMAPRAGFEPATHGLTVRCSAS